MGFQGDKAHQVTIAVIESKFKPQYIITELCVLWETHSEKERENMSQETDQRSKCVQLLE
jgi:hypothetical protein